MNNFIKFLFTIILILTFFIPLQGQTRNKIYQKFQSPKPDLVVNGMNVNHQNIVYSTIKNNGSSFTGKCRVYLVLIYGLTKTAKWTIVDKSIVSTQLPYSLSKSLAQTPPLKNGSYTLRLIVDYGNKIEESDETNNVAVKKFSIREKLPDLTVNRLSVSRSGDSFKYNYYNKGGKLLQDYEIGFILDRKRSNIKIFKRAASQIVHRNAHSMLWNTTFRSIFGYIPQKGVLHSITVVIDPSKEVKESDERNNISSVSFMAK